jgi:hypothetical protein
MSTVPSGAKFNKLLMKLIIKAAKGDDQAVLAIAKEMVKLFEEGLEEAEDIAKSKG